MITFNEKKSNIVHYRKPNTVKTSKQFFPTRMCTISC